MKLFTFRTEVRLVLRETLILKAGETLSETIYMCQEESMHGAKYEDTSAPSSRGHGPHDRESETNRVGARWKPAAAPRRITSLCQHPRNLLPILLTQPDMHPMVGRHALNLRPSPTHAQALT
jgi:hypothetical protein